MLTLTEYEKIVAQEIIDPDHIDGGFDAIGGLDEQKREVSLRQGSLEICFELS